MSWATSAATAGSALPSTRSRARRWASSASAGWGRRSPEAGRANGLRVLATRRFHGDRRGRPVKDVDQLFPVARPPHRLLGESDYVALTVPLTPKTAGLLGEVESAAMKPGAVLINVARGQVVDEPALIRALQSGHLGGAALDVFAVEPLPPESPLWDLPNVLVTPHSMSTALEENGVLPSTLLRQPAALTWTASPSSTCSTARRGL